MRVLYASKDVITPQAFEILKSVKEQVIPDVPLDLAPVGENPHPRSTVLALGAYKSRNGERVVAGPSIAQIVTRADIVTRLGAVFRLLTAPPDLPPMEYTVIDDPLEADFFLDSLTDREVVFDIETSGDISVDMPDPQRVISVAISGGAHCYVFTELVCQAINATFCAFLERNKIIAVNSKFDLKYFPDCKPNHYFDVQLAHYALYPAAGEHGLKPCAKRYFGLDDWDEPGKAYTKGATYKEAWSDPETGAWADARKYSAGSGYERIPRTLLYEYNAWDVFATWHWYKRMQEALEADPDSKRVFDLLMKLSDMFMGVETRGITLDIPYLEQLSKELTIEKLDAEVDLNEIAGKEINPRSPKQVKEWFAEQGIPLAGTAEGVLTEFIESNGGAEDEYEHLEVQNALDFAKQLLVCRGITKTLGTYVDGYRNQAHGSTVYPGYKLHASTTGRLGGQGASMLTIPREKRLKKMVKVSAPGRLIVGADLSQAELRVMALESRDEWLISAFQPGAGDFFDLLLTQAYPERDWFDLHKRVSERRGAVTEAEGNFYNSKRASMKGVVYGVSFGRGTKAIAAALKIEMREAQRLVDAFIRPGSMFAMWREDIEYRALNGLEIVSPFGRHFQSELVTRANRQNVMNSALSFTSQSTANDICLSAALALEPQLAQYNAWLLGTIHDAIYTETPEQHAKKVGELTAHCLREAGRAVYGDIIPFDSDWGSGLTLADI